MWVYQSGRPWCKMHYNACDYIIRNIFSFVFDIVPGCTGSHTGQIKCHDTSTPQCLFAHAKQQQPLSASNACKLTALNSLQAWYQIHMLSGQCRDAPALSCLCTCISQQQRRLQNTTALKLQSTNNYNPQNA